LGKLHAALARHKGQSLRAGESKAMVFYQAALLAFPENHLAANDLGVLLAQNGNFADARGALEHSLSIYRQSAGWHNLAVVYGQLGDAELSRRAEWHAEMARRAEAARAGGNPDSQRLVRWVDPATFAQANNEVPAPAPAAPAGTASPPNSAGQPTPARRPAVARGPASTAGTPTIGQAPWAAQPTRN
jgi:tetratricopeptide (TPR) repeat protein